MHTDEMEDPGAEMAVAGTLARDPTAWAQVGENLRAEMFTIPVARRAFAVLAEVNARLPAGARPEVRAAAYEEAERSGTLGASWAACLSPLSPLELCEAASRIGELWLGRLMAELGRLRLEDPSLRLADLVESEARKHRAAGGGYAGERLRGE